MSSCNKKGILMTTVVSLIVLAVSAAVLFGVIFFWKIDVENQVKMSICEFSVLIKSKLIIWGFDVSGYELKCNPIDVKIEVDDNNVNEIIAENMYNCWKNLGEGKLDIIASWYLNPFKENTACVICSKIYPSDGSTIQIGLNQLQTTMHNYKLPREERSFVDSFKSSDKVLGFDLGSEAKFTVTETKPLYIVYFFYKTKDWDKLDILGLTTVGGGVGAAATKTGRRVIPIVLKGVGKRVLGQIGIGFIIGDVAGMVAYKGELAQGVMLVSGKEIADRCAVLK